MFKKTMATWPILVVALISGVLSFPSFAHHSRAPFDLDRTLEVKGEVVRVRWLNPHVYIEVQGTAEDGRSGSWMLEGHSVSGMVDNGWQRDSISAGDQITAVINPANNLNSQSGLIDHFLTSAGRQFNAFRPSPDANGEVVDTRDWAIEPATDFEGNWSYLRPRAGVLVFAQPDFSAFPLNERGLEVAADFDFDDSPLFQCGSVGLPSQLTGAYEHRWIRHEDRIIVEKQNAGVESIRTIYLDGREPPSDFQPSHIGFSVGHFEEDGNVLVIETSHFSDVKWGLSRGLDSSTEKHMVERYRITNGGLRMVMEYTLTDPVYLDEPIFFQGVFDKEPNREFDWVPCSVDSAAQHLPAD